MTPAKAQGPMQCLQFASIATFEAKIKIVLDRPDLDIDLSERHLIHNAPSSSGIAQICGRSIKGKGVLTEAELPYGMSPVVFAPDWEDRAYSCTDYQGLVIADEDAERGTIQQWIRDYGPLYTQSGHGCTLVGYDDDRQEWILKETGGADIGDNGYFYYNYGYMDGRLVVAFTGDVYYGPTRLPEPASALVLLVGLPWVLRRRGKVR